MLQKLVLCVPFCTGGGELWAADPSKCPMSLFSNRLPKPNKQNPSQRMPTSTRADWSFGSFTSWNEQSTTTTNLDAPLLRLMLGLAASEETTWSNVDTTSAFLNADIQEENIVLVTPPFIVVNKNIVKPNTAQQVTKTIFGFRGAPRLLVRKTRSTASKSRIHL